MSDQDNTTLTFDEALDLFCDKINSVRQANHPGYHAPVILEPGTKNIRVVSCLVAGTSRTVYCFIEKETGDILKAAGWKKAAKGIRGNIFNPESYANADPHGSWLYR